MTKTLRDLMARAQASYRFSSEAQMDQFLAGLPLSAEQRLSFKLEMQRTGRWQPQGHRLQANLATDQARDNGLATDRRAYKSPTPTSEVTRLLERAGLPPTRSYSTAECEDRLQEAGFDVEQRVACKLELSSLKLLRR